ncbi:MAG: ERF family protein [Thermoanaerobaculia bacterium]
MMPEEEQERKLTPAEYYRPAIGFRHSNDTRRLFEALTVVQGQIRNVEKNQENPHFHSRYADLAAVWDAIRGPLTGAGLCIIQGASTTWVTGAALVTVTTRLTHSSGEWIENDLQAAAGIGRPQEVGSTITYLKRYALCALMGIASEDEDDDGEGAEGRGRQADKQPDKGQPPKKQAPAATAKPKGKLSEKDAKAVLVAFEKFKVTKAQLEEKLGKPADAWTDDERQRAVAIYKELEEGTRKEDIFGQQIEDPKSKDEPGAKG